MSPTIRLRKTDFGILLCSNVLATQRANGASPRAYYLKQALVNAGWVTYYSSDGLTTSSSDLWTTNAFQGVLLQSAIGAANVTSTVDGIWCCLRSPAVDANGDYLHICISPSHGQWFNPTVRGATNAMITYGIGAKTGDAWLAGGVHAYIRLGMALSPSTTIFSSGAAFLATTSTTAIGTLPSAPNAIWTTHVAGTSDAAAGYLKSMTVVTDGNQFHVVQDTGSNTIGNRYWFSVCNLVNGGYAVIEQGVTAEVTGSAGTIKGVSLMGGRIWTNVNTTAVFIDTPTMAGGWRTAYIKRAVDNSIWTGGLACPEPVGWEAGVDQGFYDGTTVFPNVVPLRAISCSNSTHFDLGNVSDFLLMGNTLISDVDRIVDSVAGKIWWVLKDAKAYLLSWSTTDDPSLRTTVIPT